MADDSHAEFLAALDRQAGERLAARRARRESSKPCKVCHGSCSVTRYVLPNVLALVECKSCNGTGAAS